jgi:hypothetical protein
LTPSLGRSEAPVWSLTTPWAAFEQLFMVFWTFQNAGKRVSHSEKAQKSLNHTRESEKRKDKRGRGRRRKRKKYGSFSGRVVNFLLRSPSASVARDNFISCFSNYGAPDPKSSPTQLNVKWSVFSFLSFKKWRLSPT